MTYAKNFASGSVPDEVWAELAKHYSQRQITDPAPRTDRVGAGTAEQAMAEEERPEPKRLLN